MAQRVNTLLTDDVDGSEAVETVRFALDGVEYEIDLNEAHAGELREGLARYMAAGRRLGAGRSGGGGSAGRGSARSSSRGGTRRDPEQTRAIRAGAVANGRQVSERGRISDDVVAAYDAAH